MTFKVKDHYYNKAKQENFLARSIYKLEEVDKKYSIIRANDNVLDLGYYPGSWIQYISNQIKPNGKVVGIDIQPINPKLSKLDNVTLFQKDMFDINHLADLAVDSLFDVVVSDMAPKTTGIKSVDQIRSLELVEKVITVLPRFLKPGGNFVIKVFESQDAQDYFKSQKNLFKKISFLRPKSTRSVSKEYFMIGQNYQLNET
jgi:23S rRNA (uridine2552-2'-O)-methyltransferase